MGGPRNPVIWDHGQTAYHRPRYLAGVVGRGAESRFAPCMSGCCMAPKSLQLCESWASPGKVQAGGKGEALAPQSWAGG